ncbi:DinB family protein [Dyadobacter crusticola]|uniref:DinB family protein n=1 Tax=Dyadobacter crusticola TaxID=292407 RepID=UPI0012F89FE9|nr:DinB family protein [Dyadobacter crusticola]
MELDRYKQLLDYNVWANRRLMAQMKELPPSEFHLELGGSFPSLRLTVIHLLEADWLWLHRWDNQPLAAVPTDWDTSTAASVDRIWTTIQEQIAAVYNNRLAGHMDTILHFNTKRGDPYSMPLWQTLHHVVNHATYHRGQLSNMIRTLGYKPVGTDLFLFYDEENRRTDQQ